MALVVRKRFLQTPTGAGGSVSDGDKGDISVTGSGATWTIDNDVVTFAKMQNISTARILGRDTASSGDVEELTAAEVLALLGGSSGGGSPVGYLRSFDGIAVRGSQGRRLGAGFSRTQRRSALR
jgi:hypothetical protein